MVRAVFRSGLHHLFLPGLVPWQWPNISPNYRHSWDHSAGKRPGPNPPSPNHHFPRKMFFLQASLPPLNGKSKSRKKIFLKFLKFSENFDSATILIVWNRQFQQCFRQPSRCPTNMPLGSSCCLWPKSPRLKFHANRSYGFCATEGRILAKMSAFCVTNDRKVTTFLRTRWRPQF